MFTPELAPVTTASTVPAGGQIAVEAGSVDFAQVLQLAETVSPAVRAREAHLAAPLAQTIAWMWLGFLLVGAIAWLAYRYWRRRHPPRAPTPERSYSQCLGQRLAKSRGAAKSKRRDRPAKRPPPRPLGRVQFLRCLRR